MGFGVWSALLSAAIAGGSLTCAALYVRPRAIALTGAGATLATMATVVLVWAIRVASGRLDATIAAAFLALGAGGGGFALAAALAAPLTRWPKPAPLPTALGPDDGLVHVVLLADCEPERYDPRAITQTMNEFEAADAPMPPELARPLVYAAERSRYRRLGGSPSRPAVRAIAGRAEAALAEAGRPAPVSVAFCAGDEDLAHVLARLATAGARRFAVVPLGVAWTRHFEDALAPARTRDAGAAGIRVEVADPLSSAGAITDAIAESVASAVASEIGESGVCLVSAGRPEELQALSRQETEQTTFFVQRVRAALVDRGFSGDLVRQGWMEWQDPDVSEAVRHLGAMGAHAVVLAPVTYPVETLDTVIDLKFVAERASEEIGARVQALPAWGEDPATIDALVSRALTAMKRLDEAG